MQGLPLQSSVKLRLLCSQVLKELLGQGIDVSAGPSTPPSHDPVIPTALKVHRTQGVGNQAAAGVPRPVSRGLAPPEGLLSPQYEKTLKLTADARFGEYPTESADLWAPGSSAWGLAQTPSQEPVLPHLPQQGSSRGRTVLPVPPSAASAEAVAVLMAQGGLGSVS